MARALGSDPEVVKAQAIVQQGFQDFVGSKSHGCKSTEQGGFPGTKPRKGYGNQAISLAGFRSQEAMKSLLGKELVHHYFRITTGRCMGDRGYVEIMKAFPEQKAYHQGHLISYNTLLGQTRNGGNLSNVILGCLEQNDNGHN